MTRSNNVAATASNLIPIKRALISVSDKTGIVDFAQTIHQQGVEILSTGGTFRLLEQNGVPAIEISDYTHFPEMMDGRVKTLHPKVHGGILGRRGIDDEIMANHDIDAIDMVVVNLYPFEQAVSNPDCSLENAIENIDIGGPTMVRAAAKNHAFVNIVVSTDDYARILKEMSENQGCTSHQTRFDLAVKAYEHTAAYDGAIANYFGRLAPGGSEQFPRTFTSQFVKTQEMRYGENPHQHAAFYRETKPQEPCIASAKQVQGKELSFNNVADTDAALETVKLFDRPSCVIVKHANPCGVAESVDIKSAYELAFATDPESAFGGIVAFNRELDCDTARAIVDRQFVEVIIAPSVSSAAIEVISKKKNVRVLSTGPWAFNQEGSNQGVSGQGATTDKPPISTLISNSDFDYKRVTGGLLLQTRDRGMKTAADLRVVTKRTPSENEINDLLFAWKVAKMVKSNAIVYARGSQTIGVGAGQMSRVNSARIAAIKAEHAGFELSKSVMASDAFFPFRDGIDNAAAAGIAAIIQPGGSMRDEETIAAANEHGIAMVFTNMRHFRH